MPTVNRPPSPYEQIAAHVRLEIKEGRLAAGTVLPSVRRIADDWDVSAATVGRAVALLRDEGWIVTRPGRTAIVAQQPPKPSD